MSDRLHLVHHSPRSASLYRQWSARGKATFQRELFLIRHGDVTSVCEQVYPVLLILLFLCGRLAPHPPGHRLLGLVTYPLLTTLNHICWSFIFLWSSCRILRGVYYNSKMLRLKQGNVLNNKWELWLVQAVSGGYEG